MPNAFLLNGHQPYSFSPGRLNGSLLERASEHLTSGGFTVRTSAVSDDWNVDEEIEKHTWADLILVQMPINWMGVSWRMKQYMDEVYTAGMDGRLCNGDGRSRQDPSLQYGTGGSCTGTKYMLSVTFNAPGNAFDDPSQTFFEGRALDDLLWPMHLNMRFFGMTALPSFACFDVLKNPSIDDDFARWSDHLATHLTNAALTKGGDA